MTALERERLAAYLDGELTPGERTAVERELKASEEARRLLAELAALDDLARSQPVEAPAGYFEALPGRVRGRLEGASPRRRTLPNWAWAAAAALVVAAVAPLTLNRIDSSAPEPARRAEAPRPPDADSAAAGEALSEALPTVAATPPTRSPARRREPREEADADAAEPRASAPEQSPERRAERRTRENAGEAAAGFSSNATAELEEGVAVAEPPPPPPPPAPAAPAPVPATTPKGAATAGGPQEARPGARLVLTDSLNEDREQARQQAPAAVRESARGAPASDVAIGADAERFTALAGQRPRTAEAARALREEWRSFVMLYPRSALADEARVRTVESGLEAWRLGEEEADREIAREDARDYLAREDAAQPGRVEALLATLDR